MRPQTKVRLLFTLHVSLVIFQSSNISSMSVHVLTVPIRLALSLYNYSLSKVSLLTFIYSLLKHNISLILIQTTKLKPNKTGDNRRFLESTTNWINRNERQWIEIDFGYLGIPPVDSDYVIIQLRECCRALKTLVNNPKSFPDVTFVVGTPPNEVKEIPAHKAILLARAPHLLKDIVCSESSCPSLLSFFHLFDFVYFSLLLFLFVRSHHFDYFVCQII